MVLLRVRPHVFQYQVHGALELLFRSVKVRRQTYSAASEGAYDPVHSEKAEEPLGVSITRPERDDACMAGRINGCDEPQIRLGHHPSDNVSGACRHGSLNFLHPQFQKK